MNHIERIAKCILAVTTDALLARARSAIDRDEPFIYDVAADSGQIVANVKHMDWFVKEVANWLIDNTTKWSRLQHVS